MTSLTATENATIERAADAPMLAQVEQWAAVNSGTGNLAGLRTVACHLADAFAALPGDIRLVAPDPVESVDAAGKIRTAQRAGFGLAVLPGDAIKGDAHYLVAVFFVAGKAVDGELQGV